MLEEGVEHARRAGREREIAPRIRDAAMEKPSSRLAAAVGAAAEGLRRSRRRACSSCCLAARHSARPAPAAPILAGPGTIPQKQEIRSPLGPESRSSTISTATATESRRPHARRARRPVLLAAARASGRRAVGRGVGAVDGPARRAAAAGRGRRRRGAARRRAAAAAARRLRRPPRRRRPAAAHSHRPRAGWPPPPTAGSGRRDALAHEHAEAAARREIVHESEQLQRMVEGAAAAGEVARRARRHLAAPAHVELALFSTSPPSSPPPTSQPVLRGARGVVGTASAARRGGR